jgi:hypothetical protein
MPYSKEELTTMRIKQVRVPEQYEQVMYPMFPYPDLPPISLRDIFINVNNFTGTADTL